MGYHLVPRNKNVDTFVMGAFSWPWMLKAGVGLPFGYGEGVVPASYVYTERPDGKSISDNDGAKVTAKEARQMAQLARWVVQYHKNLAWDWSRYPEQERNEMSSGHYRHLYTVPVREDFLEKALDFADWAETSGGFSIK